MREIRRSQSRALLEPYLVDASRRVHGEAEEIAWPESHEHVVSLMREWSERGTEVTASGGGTGVTGARVPLGGAVIATDRMCSVSEPRPAESGARALMTVGAGATLGAVDEAAAAHGWLYPPDPTEKTAFVGGTVATNASGSRSFRFGSTRAWIHGLRGVLADGRSFHASREISTRRGARIVLPLDDGSELTIPAPDWPGAGTRKSSAGLYSAPGMDAIDLLVGSEGMLAVVTEVELILVPRPAATLASIVLFSGETEALSFAASLQRLRSSPSGPSCVELFDGACLDLVRQRGVPVPSGSRAAIYCELDCGDQVSERDALERWSAKVESTAGVLDAWAGADVADRERFRQMRHALPVTLNELLARRGVPKQATDTAVPPGGIADYIRALRARVEKDRIEHVVFGHVGDDHVHVNLIASDQSGIPKVEQALADIVDLAVKRGGTVSAEHGIGKLKRAALANQVGTATLASMRRVRRLFDPRERLARGNVFVEQRGETT